MSYSSRPHGLQHTRLPCPSLSSRLSTTNSMDMNLNNLTISSSATLFSFCLQSFPASGSFPVGSITMNEASGGDRITAELFKILKGDAVKVLHSIWQQIWKIQQWPQDWKRSVFITVPKKGSAKEHSNYWTVSLISHASKVMLKILQVRFQQYMKWELPEIPRWVSKRQRNQRSNYQHP